MNQIKCPNCGEVINLTEQQFNTVLSQVQEEEIEKRLLVIREEKEKELELAKEKAIRETKEELQKEIIALKESILRSELEQKNLASSLESSIKLKEQEILAIKDKEVSDLTLKLKEMEMEKENGINALKEKIELEKSANALKEKEAEAEFAERLKEKDEVIALYKDMKAKLSTKMVGESLEKHCENEFENLRALGFQNAYFGKDNEVVDGSKGDYIFKDFTKSGTEYVSIMFEMKNESDTTATKKRNEDFFKELDKDRKAKGCEYAILVSLLEQDNELYNAGIVDVSHKYPKMYVIRPQFFIPMITLLKNTAANSMEVKDQLAEYQAQNIDFVHFEENIDAFKSRFGNNCRLASEHFETAVTEIDKSIQALERVKSSLLSSERQLRLANDKAQELSVKKLTKGCPAVRKQIADSNDE